MIAVSLPTRGYPWLFSPFETGILAVMAFAAYSLISPTIAFSLQESSVASSQVPPHHGKLNGASTSDTTGLGDHHEHTLLRTVSELRDTVKVLEESQRELLEELRTIKNDQLDSYMYARKHLSFTLRLCTQVERILEQEDSKSRSLKVLQAIGEDILNALERYHAPGSGDPLRFIKQRTMQPSFYEQDYINHSWNSSVITSPTAGNDPRDQWKSF